MKISLFKKELTSYLLKIKFKLKNQVQTMKHKLQTINPKLEKKINHISQVSSYKRFLTE